MTYSFSVQSDGTEESRNPIPSVYIDGKRLGIVSFDLSYETATDEGDDGKNTIYVAGYLHQEFPAILKEYIIDLTTNECVELQGE